MSVRSSVRQSVSPSVRNAIGEMWFSRLLFKIDGWNFLSKFPSLWSIMNHKTPIKHKNRLVGRACLIFSLKCFCVCALLLVPVEVLWQTDPDLNLIFAKLICFMHQWVTTILAGIKESGKTLEHGVSLEFNCKWPGIR